MVECDCDCDCDFSDSSHESSAGLRAWWGARGVLRSTILFGYTTTCTRLTPP